MHYEDEQLELAAETAHEVNRAYCYGLGDDSQLAWDEAPKWQKQSALLGVKAIVENPALPSSALHEGWLAQKKADGWKYGPVKDPDKKEHPCFVPFNELPVEQKVKDVLFVMTVRGVLGMNAVNEE